MAIIITIACVGRFDPRIVKQIKMTAAYSTKYVREWNIVVVVWEMGIGGVGWRRVCVERGIIPDRGVIVVVWEWEIGGVGWHRVCVEWDIVPERGVALDWWLRRSQILERRAVLTGTEGRGNISSCKSEELRVDPAIVDNREGPHDAALEHRWWTPVRRCSLEWPAVTTSALPLRFGHTRHS